MEDKKNKGEGSDEKLVNLAKKEWLRIYRNS